MTYIFPFFPHRILNSLLAKDKISEMWTKAPTPRNKYVYLGLDGKACYY